jgi:hypothetical protein
MFSATLYLSHAAKSYSPPLPPKTYKDVSDMQNVEGKNARFNYIGALFSNFMYLLK